VVNLLDGRNLVSVVETKIGAGPTHVVFTGIDVSGVRSLSVGRETISLNGRSHRIDPGRIYHSGIEIGGERPAVLDRNLKHLSRMLVEQSPPGSLAFLLNGNGVIPSRGGFERAVLEHLSEAVARVFTGDVVAGVRMLRGCGFGLTPSGDDFAAGMLVAMHVLNALPGMRVIETVEAVYQSARSGNILSDTLLSLARDGRLTERVKGLVVAVLSGTEECVRKHTEKLLLLGHTSGADFGTGFCMTMQRGEAFLQPTRGAEDTLLLHEGETT
jgi:hypothetical protein